jgi:DNA-binding MarR family transcriptional regulator
MPKASKKADLAKMWAGMFPEAAMRPGGGLPSEAELHALVMVSIVRAGKEIERRLDNFVRPLGLTASRAAALLQLEFRGRLTPSELGERLFVTRGNMTGLVDGLVKGGLVRRVPRENDRRAHDLELTKRGRDFVEAYLPHHQKVLSKLNAGLSECEAVQLASLLEKFSIGMQHVEPPQQVSSIRP